MNRFAATLTLCASALASACGGAGDKGPTQSTTTVASVSVSPSDQTLAPQQTVQLSATMKDAQGNTLGGHAVDLSSSQSSVASVSSSGLVTAVAGGSAVITATSEGQAVRPRSR